MEKTQDLIKKVAELEARITKLEGSDQAKPSSKQSNKKISVRGLFNSKGAKNDVQRTLVVGYYLEKYEGTESFSVVDLDNCFRSARQSVPQNLNDKVNMNIRKDHIMDAKNKKDGRKAFMLTDVGKNSVENGFENK